MKGGKRKLSLKWRIRQAIRKSIFYRFWITAILKPKMLFFLFRMKKRLPLQERKRHTYIVAKS